jgi:hypothetical protein
MESTGEPDSIQVSASTADLLTKAGKSYWVKAREDLVHAKGKGKVRNMYQIRKHSPGLLQLTEFCRHLNIQTKLTLCFSSFDVLCSLFAFVLGSNGTCD